MSSMTETELTRLTSTIRKAGARALELATSDFEVRKKADQSPVTSTDLEVNRILHEMQLTYFPEDGWLSEESPDDPGRLGKTRVWIVDPIDGTNAYINRVPEFCISVGLTEAGKPKMAAIFNPSTDELFTAVSGQGLYLNGKPLTSLPSQRIRSLVMVSPREFRNGRWAGLDGFVECRPTLSIANALALVAAGRIQATLTIEPENEWDLAAGVLLIEESGGFVTDAMGQQFTFNQPTPRFQGVIAVASAAGKDIHQLFQTHALQALAEKKRS